MQSKSTETNPRAFNPMSVSGLSEEARKAVKAAFDAMSAWRVEIVKSSEKNTEQVIEKMAAAAEALGWPEQIVEATTAQLQSISKIQIQTMDHVMDAWEEQIKSPNPLIGPSATMLSKLKSLPGFSSAGTWPGLGAQQPVAANPMQFWMQAAEQWQRGWSEAMSFWGKLGNPYEGGGARRH